MGVLILNIADDSAKINRTVTKGGPISKHPDTIENGLY